MQLLPAQRLTKLVVEGQLFKKLALARRFHAVKDVPICTITRFHDSLALST